MRAAFPGIAPRTRTPNRDETWQRPWLRGSLLLRAMLNEPWDGETWQQIRHEVPNAVAEQARIAGAGWFN